MDASDRIKKAQSKALWGDYSQQKLATQAGCVYNTCGQNLQSTCKVNYVTYEVRYQIAQGKKNCKPCSTDCL